ncbi:MAG: F0F1 ATP synthase subunit epsilon [Actinomycetota bacterium]
MATPMSVSIVSPEEELWRGEAEMVIARSPEGEFAILHGHIPFLAALVPGRVSVVSGSEREEFFVSGGFLEASKSQGLDSKSEQGDEHDYHVIVLADAAEDLHHIDVAEARRRLEEAQRKAEDHGDDLAEARMRIEMARVEIAESRGQ